MLLPSLDGSAAQSVPITGVPIGNNPPDYYPTTFRARHGYLVKFPHPTPPKLQVMVRQLSYGGTFTSTLPTIISPSS